MNTTETITPKTKAPAKAKGAPKSKAAKPAPVAKPAKAPAVEKNGIRAPRDGSLCAQAWAVFDDLAKKGDVTLAAARDVAKVKGLNEGNVTTEIGRWRKFNGIKPAGARKSA